MRSYTIVGGGLAGSLLANYMGGAGARVEVYERRADMRRAALERGRSINLALSVRGLHALEEIGLKGDILRLAIPMKGRMIHALDGELDFQRYSIHPNEMIYSVSRHGLNVALVDAAERCGVRFHFGQKCQGLDVKSGLLEMHDESSGQTQTVAADTIIGADGAYSAVRAQLQRRDRYDYHQNYLDWGYKELTMPALGGGGFALQKHALHIWPRHDFMLIALPNLDGSFTCTLFLPFEGRHSFEALRTDQDVLAFFHEQFGDAVPHMPTLLDDYRHNPTSSLLYVRCFPWHEGDRVVLVGDACHAVVPFYGQGMNAAFEDCSVLHQCLRQNGDDVAAAFACYQEMRKPNTDALADLSLRNFEEMRDRVSRRGYLLKKSAEQALHRLFPEHFLPLYSMVTFSRIPYADAVERARRQDRLLALLGLGLAAGVPAALLAALRKICATSNGASEAEPTGPAGSCRRG